MLGFLGDLVGVAYLTLLALQDNVSYYDGDSLREQILSGIHLATNQSHFDSVWGVVFIISGILVSAIAIFIFDYFISLCKTDFTKKQKLFSALSIAVFTAPYTFLIPSEIFY